MSAINQMGGGEETTQELSTNHVDVDNDQAYYFGGGCVCALARAPEDISKSRTASQSECRGEMFPGRKVSNINELGDKRSESPVKQKKTDKKCN